MYAQYVSLNPHIQLTHLSTIDIPSPPQPLQIKSAVAVEGLKGYIYVEAYKQQHVKQAIEDIGNLRIGKWQQLMVPIKEMTDVLRVVKDTTALKRGSWVRIKRSIYKDDIAQVRVPHMLCCCSRVGAHICVCVVQ